MFTKLSNSWALVKASAQVLRADKELVIFPILSSIGTLVVTLTFFLPTILAGAFDTLFSQRSQIMGFIVVFFFYLAQYLVIFFANTALVGAALIRLRGGNPTVGDGFRIAFSRFGAILGYALIAATVGMILKTLSKKSGGFGRAIISLIGFAWNIATFLVVPVLAVENVGPIEAVKRSVQLLKKTWGEQIAGNLGMGAFFGLVTFLALLVGISATFLAFAVTEAVWLALLVGLLFIFALVIIGLISSTLNGVYTAAVYLYAVEGRSEGFFKPELVEGAFRSLK